MDEPTGVRQNRGAILDDANASVRSASGRTGASEPQKYQHRAIQTHDVFIIQSSDLPSDLGFCDGCDFVDHKTARVCQAVSLIGDDGQSK